MSEQIIVLKEKDPSEAKQKYNLLLWYDSPKRKDYNGSVGWFVMKLECDYLNFTQILVDMKRYEDTLTIFVNFEERIIMWFFKP